MNIYLNEPDVVSESTTKAKLVVQSNLNEPDVVSESTTKAKLVVQSNGVIRYNPTIVNVDNAPVMLDGITEEIGLDKEV